MAQRKPDDDTRSQRQKFIEAARELGASHSEEIFRHALGKIAKVPGAKAKKAAKKPKR